MDMIDASLARATGATDGGVEVNGVDVEHIPETGIPQTNKDTIYLKV